MTKKYCWYLIVLMVVLAGCSKPAAPVATAAPQSIATPIVITATSAPTVKPTANPTAALATSMLTPTQPPQLNPSPRLSNLQATDFAIWMIDLHPNLYF
jgi:hypothetical protein